MEGAGDASAGDESVADASADAGRACNWDPRFLERSFPILVAANRYYDPEVRGWDNVPAAGPMLLVGNHSGGVLSPDTWVLMEAWYGTRGFDRPLVMLGFDILFVVPGIRELMQNAGVVAASTENVERAFAAGDAVLVYPGGEIELYRPWTERNRIDFAGRKGFIELALRTGVPIVPVVAHGGHETQIVVSRGERMARAMRLDRIRAGAFPFSFNFPAGLAPSWIPYVPLPAKITMQVCEPMRWPNLGPEAAEDPETVDRCYEQVVDLMQDTLTGLAAERPNPIWSRIRSLLP